MWRRSGTINWSLSPQMVLNSAVKRTITPPTRSPIPPRELSQQDRLPVAPARTVRPARVFSQARSASPERAPFGIPPGHRRVPIAPKPAPSPSESAEDNLSDTQVGPHQIPDLRKRRSERTRRVAGTPGYPEVRPTASYNSKITAEDSALLLDLKENYNLSWSVPYLTQQALLLVRANHNRPRDWVLGLTPPTETAKPLADNAWNRQQIADFLPGRSRQTLQVYHATKLKNRGKSLTDGQVQELLRAEEEADMKKWRAIAVKMKITVEEAKTMWTEAQEKRAAQAGRGGSSDGREDVS